MKRAFCFGLSAILIADMAVAADEPSRSQRHGDVFVGDWQGTWGDDALCVQVIAWEKGPYTANVLAAFDTCDPRLAELKGKRSGDRVEFRGQQDGTAWTGRIKGSVFKGKTAGAKSASFRLKKVVRLSPTLGAKAPEGAVVLFDGTSFDNWVRAEPDSSGVDSGGQAGENKCRWKLLDNGAAEVRGGGIVSMHGFVDHKLHLEFRTPFRPNATGQGRGNSGVFLQGRYEVQILDSYGLEGKRNECGGIYQVAQPRVNMAAPPRQWQTYDITFFAPKFDENGEKKRDAVITVLHNGVMIHENQPVPHPTSGSIGGDIREAQGVHLQDLGNPVQYRNIWAVELD